MPLTLMQSRAIDELMLLLVEWLPGSSPWGAYTFADAAAENGVGEFWRGGSKKPALTELLRLTYERESGHFCPLVLTIVQRGMSYRRQKDWPVLRADVEGLNAIVERLGFKDPGALGPRLPRLAPGTGTGVDARRAATIPAGTS
jgi:hypothetical protein